MDNFSTSQKIRISITIVWELITILIAGGIADGYSSFNYMTFTGSMIFFNLPIILYWLGYWIWGEKYLYSFFAFPVIKIAKLLKLIIAKKEKPSLSIKVLFSPKKIFFYFTNFFIVFASFAVIYIAAKEQYYEDISYILGEVLGSWLVLLVLVHYLFVKNISALNKIPVSIPAILFLLSSIYISYPEYKEAKDAKDAMSSMVETIEQDYLSLATNRDVSAGISPIKVDPSNKMYNLIEFVNKSREKSASILIDYNNSIPNEFEYILSPQTLTDIQRIKLAKNDVRDLLSNIPIYRQRIQDHFESLEKGILSLDINNEMKQKMLKGFLKTKSTNLNIYSEYFLIQENMLNDIHQLLSLMEEASGSYEYDKESEQILFENDEYLSQYSALVASITNGALLEREWADKAQGQELSWLSKLKEAYE